MHKCILLLQKATRLRSQTRGAQVFWGVFLSIFMVSIVVYVAELPWFLTHAFHGLERARPRATGLDTSNNHTNTHAQTHTRTENTQSEVAQVRREARKSIPAKGLNLLTGKTNFQ